MMSIDRVILTDESYDGERRDCLSRRVIIMMGRGGMVLPYESYDGERHGRSYHTSHMMGRGGMVLLDESYDGERRDCLTRRVI